MNEEARDHRTEGGGGASNQGAKMPRDSGRGDTEAAPPPWSASKDFLSGTTRPLSLHHLDGCRVSLSVTTSGRSAGSTPRSALEGDQVSLVVGHAMALCASDARA